MENMLKHAEERASRVEDLMDRALEHKLTEYENRLALIENELRQMMQTLNEAKATGEVTKHDSDNLHSETLRRFIEFGEKLGEIHREVKNVQEGLANEEKAVERIREEETTAISSVKSWEKKTLKNLNKRLVSKKTLDNVLKKLLSGKNKAKLDRVVRTASTSPKVRISLVNAVLNDKKLRARLVNDVLVGTRGKLKREKVTSKVAKAATKKLIENAKPGLKKAAKSAAKKAVKTEAAKV